MNQKDKDELIEEFSKLKADWEKFYALAVETERKLKQYEDAEKQGLLLRLPCKVGDTIYIASPRCGVVEAEILNFEVYANVLYAKLNIGFSVNLTKELGKTVFLTKEEAEQKLERMKGE